jgi:translocator protein
MSSFYSILISLGICVVAAALEGVCAGKDVKSYLARLRSPAYSPPLWAWYIIGGLYYATFCFVLYRILTGGSNSMLTRTTLVLVLAMMLANALWNLVFFRAQNLSLSLLLAFLAPVFDVILFLFLLQLDRLAAWALIPYLIYRLYSLWWAAALWKINRSPA